MIQVKIKMGIENSQFSAREKEVIDLLLQGKSNKQIAFELHIAQSTVEYHLKNIYLKLDVASRTEAVLRLKLSIGDDPPHELRKSTVETDSGRVLERRGWLRIVLPLLIGLLVIGIVIGISYLSQVHMYDNFDNPAFDGNWNSERWRLENSVTLENTIIEQRNRALNLSRQQSGAGILETSREWRGQEIGFVEGTVYMDSRTDPSIGSVGLSIAGLVDDKWWWLGCGIETNEEPNSPQALCRSSDGYTSSGIDVQYNSWHTIRIEVDSDSANMTLFIDGMKAGTYPHPNPESFKQSLLRIQLVAWSRNGDLVTGKFDDIRIDHK